jgi:hypothetical protein
VSIASAELWVRRVVAIIVTTLSFAIFLPIGGFFYVFLLARATISLTLASFLSAMTSAPLSANVEHLLQHSVSFFPNGLGIIWNAGRAIWRGENFGSSDLRHDSLTLLTNVILAILFFIVLMLLLNALGWSGVRVPAILSWFLGTPILLLLSIALIGIVVVIFWQVFQDSWKRLWSPGTK